MRVVLSKRAQWATDEEIALNPQLRNTYRERFALVEGRRFRIAAGSLDAMWWCEEVEPNGLPTMGGEKNCEIVSWCKWAFSLREARELIATLVAEGGPK